MDGVLLWWYWRGWWSRWCWSRMELILSFIPSFALLYLVKVGPLVFADAVIRTTYTISTVINHKQRADTYPSPSNSFLRFWSMTIVEIKRNTRLPQRSQHPFDHIPFIPPQGYHFHFWPCPKQVAAKGSCAIMLILLILFTSTDCHFSAIVESLDVTALLCHVVFEIFYTFLARCRSFVDNERQYHCWIFLQHPENHGCMNDHVTCQGALGIEFWRTTTVSCGSL